jgi:hypothetical protein
MFRNPFTHKIVLGFYETRLRRSEAALSVTAAVDLPLGYFVLGYSAWLSSV